MTVEDVQGVFITRLDASNVKYHFEQTCIGHIITCTQCRVYPVGYTMFASNVSFIHGRIFLWIVGFGHFTENILADCSKTSHTPLKKNTLPGNETESTSHGHFSRIATK